MTITYKQLLAQGKEKLLEAGVTDYEIDAWLLLQYVTGISRAKFLMDPDTKVLESQIIDYKEYIEKRASHYPFQYITHTQEFMGMEFYVDERVLIPRQDTEILVETVLDYLEPDMTVLDMCTGSGCILISLAANKHLETGVGVDFSKDALQVAKKNSENLGQNQLQFVHSNLFEKIEPNHQFDIIVSNPPYIESSVIPTLMEEVKVYEPEMALDGSEDGLEFYKKITMEAKAYLKHKAMLFFEIGCGQGKAVAKLMEDQGFTHIHIKKDLAGLDRVVYGTIEK